jgi:dTDP-4-dehydrorhamnose 3,5-epimerase
LKAPARFDFISTPLAGLTVVRRKPIQDERGLFERLYCREELLAAGISKPIVQINRSLTRKTGTVRGMHFQRPPHAETKIVSCLRGRIFDVAVDIRAGSSTFLQWHGETLSEENCLSLIIPEGFAHGFQTLTPDCELLYLHTAAYEPQAEGALNAQDSRLGIAWPLPIGEMSDRDRSYPSLSRDFSGIQP